MSKPETTIPPWKCPTCFRESERLGPSSEGEVHKIIPIGYSIDEATGEKRPLTKEQEEWSDSLLEKSLRKTP